MTVYEKLKKENRKLNEAIRKNRLYKQNEFYGIRSLIGNDWAMIYCIIGARDAGKSYSVMEYFIRKWKAKKNPFVWLRIKESSTKKLLTNKAHDLVDADIARKYDLQLTVKGTVVFDHGEEMARVLALSTFHNDKGVALFDKDFLKNNPDKYYHIALDEFQLEDSERKTTNIPYAFVNQIENLIRDTKQRVRIFLIGNTLEECSEIMSECFGFIPEEFGRYKLKSKRTVIDYMPPSEAYLERRKGSVADILMGESSTFTNKIQQDKALITKQRLIRPTATVHFTKNVIFTIWDGNIISLYKNEKCPNKIAMRPYIDMVFNPQLRDSIIQMFDTRSFLYRNLITQKKFQHACEEVKPRK